MAIRNTAASSIARYTLLSALLVLPALGACAAGRASTTDAAAAPARLIEPALARLTFDSAWSRVAHSYYDTTFRGVSWTGVRDELQPIADTTTTLAGLRRLIGNMLDRLGDSHMVLIPREYVDAMSPSLGDSASAVGAPRWSGLEFRLVDGAVLVSRVASGSPADLAGIRTGWQLEQVGEVGVRPRVERTAAVENAVARARAELALIGGLEARTNGPSDSATRLVLRDGGGQIAERLFVPVPPPGELVRFGNLPPVAAEVRQERLERGDRCVAYISLSVWMPQVIPGLERALDQNVECDGAVLDLRGNPGGVVGLMMRAGSFVFDTTVSLGEMHTRGSTLHFNVTPRRVATGGTLAGPYAGRIAILVDEFSMSTTEMFAAALQDLGRARVFGQPTPGQALPSAMIRLPTNDVLLHAFANYLTPGGERLEGRGVQPDVPVPLSRAALLAGRDAPLDAAVQWLMTAAASPTPGSSGG